MEFCGGRSGQFHEIVAISQILPGLLPKRAICLPNNNDE